MTDPWDTHSDLHSEQGGLRGEHPGRARSPMVKVHALTRLEFEKPDLDQAERFADAFGFTTAVRTPDEVQLGRRADTAQKALTEALADLGAGIRVTTEIDDGTVTARLTLTPHVDQAAAVKVVVDAFTIPSTLEIQR